MPATIQVVLQNDVENVGKSGDLVRVRPGFARNYLIPRELAVTATTSAVRRIEHEKAVALVKMEKLRKEARAVAAEIEKTVITLTHRAGEEDRLFGSVTTKEIEAAAKAKGLSFDRKKIVLKDPIRTLGTYELPVKLLPDVTAKLKLEIVAKK